MRATPSGIRFSAKIWWISTFGMGVSFCHERQFKSFRVLFTNDRNRECDSGSVERWSGEVWVLRQLSQKAKLSIDQSNYVFYSNL